MHTKTFDTTEYKSEGMIVVGLHVFQFDGFLCWMWNEVRSYDEHKRLKKDVWQGFKKHAIVNDKKVYFSVTDDFYPIDDYQIACKVVFAHDSGQFETYNYED